MVGKTLALYSAYDNTVDPTIDAFFGAVTSNSIYSALPPYIQPVDENDYIDYKWTPLYYSQNFNNISFVVKNGIEPILRGMYMQKALKVDSLIHPEFIEKFPQDMIANIIQRGSHLDPFYYKSPSVNGRLYFTPEQLSEIKNVTISDIIVRNTNFEFFSYSPFLATQKIKFENPFVDNEALSLNKSITEKIFGDDMMKLSWRFLENKTVISMNMSCKCSGFYGIGFGSLTMNYADLYVARKDTNGTLYIEDRYNEGRFPVLDTMQGGTSDVFNIKDISGNVNGYIQSVSFSRNITSSDSRDVNITFEVIPMIWTYTEKPVPGYHGATRGSMYIDFSGTNVGAVQQPQYVSAVTPGVRAMHSLLMLVTFLIIYPYSIWVTRYSSKVNWLHIHELGMTMATSEMVVSFVLALVSGSVLLQSVSSHPILGLSTFGMVVFSTTSGWAVKALMGAGNVSALSINRTIHSALGFATWIVGLVACYFGVEMYIMFVPEFETFRYVFIIWNAFLIITFGYFELKKHGLLDTVYATGSGQKSQLNLDKKMPMFTWEEIEQRVGEGACWIIIEDTIYDVADFIDVHPGGRKDMFLALGTDATLAFQGKDDPEANLSAKDRKIFISERKHVHSRLATLQLNNFAVGVIKHDDAEKPRTVRDLYPNLNPELLAIFHESSKVISPSAGKNATSPILFFPGDSVTLSAVVNNVTINRQYSPIRVTNEGFIELIIKIYANGALTSYLQTLKIGSLISIKGPTHVQNFSMITPQHKSGCFPHVVLIAAGTGLTPMLLIIDFYRRYGTWSELDIIYADGLKMLEKECDGQLRVMHLISNAQNKSEWTGLTGKLNSTIINRAFPKTWFDATRNSYFFNPMLHPDEQLPDNPGKNCEAAVSIGELGVFISGSASFAEFAGKVIADHPEYKLAKIMNLV
ncbi:Cytochrome b5 reductase 4 [Nowakowskiella sp. JEL0407]|nr:Cytochrome b5 reductase 4 [Nowakowskiella sp. JEL0407]